MNKEPFAVWVHIVTNISHLLLVINGSVNSLIYCCFSSRFRMQVVKYFDQFALRVGLKKDVTRTPGGMTNVNGLAQAGQLQVSIRKKQRIRENVFSSRPFFPQLKSSVSINGIRASHGMTTYGGGQDETPLLDR